MPADPHNLGSGVCWCGRDHSQSIWQDGYDAGLAAAHAATLDRLAEAVRGLDGYGALGHPGRQFIARAAVLALIEEARND